jgi:hypothetical protein
MTAILAVGIALLSCASPAATRVPSPPAAREATIILMDGNDCQGSPVGEFRPTPGQAIRAREAPGFVNDEARSVLLQMIPGGTAIRVFDSPAGDSSDDWTEILVISEVIERCVGTFERGSGDDSMSVTFHEFNGLDGKVSRVEIDSAQAPAAQAPLTPEWETLAASPLASQTLTAQSTPSPSASGVRPPLETPSATTAIVASVTPQRRSDLIVFTPDIIGTAIEEIERTLGAPFEIYELGIGEVEEVPEGGQERGYQVAGYTIYVTFDKNGIAHGLQVADGLLDDGYSLDDWPTVLARIGVDFVGLPDIVAPAARRWTNAYGYAIMVAAESIDGTVWTVRIYEIPH